MRTASRKDTEKEKNKKRLVLGCRINLQQSEQERCGPGASTLAGPLVEIKLGNEERGLNFLLVRRASFSVLIPKLLLEKRRVCKCNRSNWSTGKGVFLQCLKFKFGKMIGIRQFLYLSNLPRP